MKKVKITLAALAFLMTTAVTTVTSYAGRANEEPNCSSAPGIAADIFVADYLSCNSDEQDCCYVPNTNQLKQRELPE